MRRAIIALLTAAAFGQPLSRLEPKDAKSITPLEGQTFHVQGIETDGTTLWVTSVDRPTQKGFLFAFDFKTGRMRQQIEVQKGEQYHPGGLAADETSLWIPVAEYKANSSAIIQRRNKRTLQLESQFEVPDHIGCIAVTPDFIIGGNWDSRDFYLWDRSGKLIRKVSSETGNAYQDFKYDGGFLVASGSIPNRGGAVDWLELPSFRLVRRVEVGTTDRGASLTREGMMVHQGNLWFLPEDDTSRLFQMALPASR